MVTFSVYSKNTRGREEGTGGEDAVTIPLISQIPEYITKRKEKKNRSEEEIDQLNNEISITEVEKSSIEQRRDEMLKKHEMTIEQLKSYSEVRTELSNNGLSVDDLQELAKAVRWVQGQGLDLSAIVTNFLNYREMLLVCQTLQGDVSRLEKKSKGVGTEDRFS